MSDSLIVPETEAFVHLKSKINELKKELENIRKYKNLDRLPENLISKINY